MQWLHLAHLPQTDSRERFAVQDLMARRLALAFVLFGLIATAFLAINVPPFQNPDEPAHFLRAAEIADGNLVARRFSITTAEGSSQVTAGDWVDPAINAAIEPSSTISAHNDRRATRANWAEGIGWSKQRVMGSFPNTALYSPLFYLPSAIGVMYGRLARWSIVQTLFLSRLLTGVFAIAMGATAIACAGFASVWLFAVLTLPMSLSLMASSSQDALLLV